MFGLAGPVASTPIKRWLLRLGVGVVLLGALAAAGGYWLADRVINRGRDRPKVLAAPPESLERRAIPPYDGPHPRLMDLPQETFPFPLRPGQVGPVAPLFAGEPQYPFLCRTTDSGLGEPLVDNQDGYGMAVHGPDGEIAGYSKDCLLPTRIEHYYLSRDNETFLPLEEGTGPEDLVTVAIDGRDVPLIVRVETGTINRFIYLIAVPVVPELDKPRTPDLSLWNRRLVYYLRGGVGIGYRQGRVGIKTILKRRREQLAKGYAVAYSSGNQTSNTYNIWLNADTAMRHSA